MLSVYISRKPVPREQQKNREKEIVIICRINDVEHKHTYFYKYSKNLMFNSTFEIYLSYLFIHISQKSNQLIDLYLL